MKTLHCLLILIIFTFESMAQLPNFEIQGHRGCRGLMPENTLPAFLRAIDEGVETLELDVVISKDKKVVVSHDPFFHAMISTSPSGKEITPQTQGNLYELSYRQIKKYDVGSRGHASFPEQQKMAVAKPLLSVVLKETEKYAKKKGIKPLKFNIELKSLEEEYGKSQPDVETFSKLVCDVVFKQISAERVTLQSFDFAVLKHLNAGIQEKIYPKMTLSVLIEPEDDNDITRNLEKLGFVPEIWSPYYKMLTPEMVKDLHGRGIKVIPWTVNLLEDMKKVKEIGCDGLITDYPDRAKQL